MNTPPKRMRLLPLAGLLVTASCALANASPVTIVQPGAPGEESHPVTGDLATIGQHPATAADVAFMRGMIPHHAQALEMVELVAARTDSKDIRLTANRIQLSQAYEIDLMRDWLKERGAVVPGSSEHEKKDAEMMPGMLTPAEMKALADARGEEFDRLFLQSMIRHHQGALAMVERLFASPGAGQELEIWNFASHVDADQRSEIARMQHMLEERG